jgi:lysozyme
MNSLVEMLKRQEGVRSHAYQCSAGYTTVGVGRNIDSNGGLGLSDDEVDYLLRNDIQRCELELTNAFPWYKRLDRVRQDAMVSIAFNLGLTRLIKFQNALGHMADGDYILAAEEFRDSKWRQQVGMRCEELCAMIETGFYSDAA